MVPQGRFELPAYSLPMSYSTPELLRLKFSIIYLSIFAHVQSPSSSEKLTGHQHAGLFTVVVSPSISKEESHASLQNTKLGNSPITTLFNSAILLFRTVSVSSSQPNGIASTSDGKVSKRDCASQYML